MVDSWFHWPPHGGGIRVAKELAEGLVKSGHEVVLLVPSQGFRGQIVGDQNLGFRIRRLHFDRLTMTGPLLMRGIGKELQALRPEVILVANGNLLKPYVIKGSRDFCTVVQLYSYEMLCPASVGILFRDGEICRYDFLNFPHKCALCRYDKKRVILNVGPFDRTEYVRSLTFLYPFYHDLVEDSLRIPVEYVVASQYAKRRFSAIIPSDQIEIIPYGVDSLLFAPRRRTGSRVKRIFFPGRAWDPLKGFGVLMKSAEILWRERQDFRIILTSRPPHFARRPFVEQRTWEEEKDLPALYASSDIVAVPSIWAEPFGLTALEAMSCGTAVVASRAGGLPDFVADNETGLLFRPGDHKDLATKLSDLLDDEDYRLRIGAKARESVILKYSWSRVVRDYASLLERAVNERSPGSV